MKDKSFTLIKSLVILVLTCLLAGSAYGADWEQWRGPHANGISMEKGWNPKALLKGQCIAWKANVGKGHSAVAVKGNYLYTMGNKTVSTGGKRMDEDTVYCLDTRTGKEIWRYSYPCSKDRFPGPRSTPVIDGSRVYTVSLKGHLFCFNAKTGAVIWKRHIIDEGLTKLSDWAFCFSPVVEGEMLLLNAGKSGVALNKNTGKTIWKSAPEKCGLAAPILYNFQGKRMAAIQGNDTVFGVEVKTGKVLWSYKWRSFADPIMLGNDLMFLSASRARSERGCVLLKLKNGAPEVLWRNKDNNNAFQSWVVLNGYGYGIKRSNKNYIQCLDIKTGQEKWAKETEDWGSLMAADGKLIILDGDGDLIIAEATPDAYKEISSLKILKMKHWRSYGRDDVNCCWTAPVLANGYIYGRNTFGELVCVNMK
jgi:outer membrane protein assembly factor BamB